MLSRPRPSSVTVSTRPRLTRVQERGKASRAEIKLPPSSQKLRQSAASSQGCTSRRVPPSGLRAVFPFSGRPGASFLALILAVR